MRRALRVPVEVLRVIVLAAVMLAVAGCGGSSASTETNFVRGCPDYADDRLIRDSGRVPWLAHASTKRPKAWLRHAVPAGVAASPRAARAKAVALAAAVRRFCIARPRVVENSRDTRRGLGQNAVGAGDA